MIIMVAGQGAEVSRIVAQLSITEHSVRHVTTEQEALDAVKEQRYDLIVLGPEIDLRTADRIAMTLIVQAKGHKFPIVGAFIPQEGRGRRHAADVDNIDFLMEVFSLRAVESEYQRIKLQIAAT